MAHSPISLQAIGILVSGFKRSYAIQYKSLRRKLTIANTNMNGKKPVFSFSINLIVFTITTAKAPDCKTVKMISQRVRSLIFGILPLDLFHMQYQLSNRSPQKESYYTCNYISHDLPILSQATRNASFPLANKLYVCLILFFIIRQICSGFISSK